MVAMEILMETVEGTGMQTGRLAAMAMAMWDWQCVQGCRCLGNADGSWDVDGDRYRGGNRDTDGDGNGEGRCGCGYEG